MASLLFTIIHTEMCKPTMTSLYTVHVKSKIKKKKCVLKDRLRVLTTWVYSFYNKSSFIWIFFVAWLQCQTWFSQSSIYSSKPKIFFFHFIELKCLLWGFQSHLEGMLNEMSSITLVPYCPATCSLKMQHGVTKWKQTRCLITSLFKAVKLRALMNIRRLLWYPWKIIIHIINVIESKLLWGMLSWLWNRLK